MPGNLRRILFVVSLIFCLIFSVWSPHRDLPAVHGVDSTTPVSVPPVYSVETSTSEWLSLSRMKESCSLLPAFASTAWAGQSLQRIHTSHSSAHLQPRLSCYLDNRRFFHDDNTAAELPHMTGRARFEPIENDESFFTTLQQEEVNEFHFHPSMAIVFAATWNSVNLYHLLADQLLGLAFTLHEWSEGVLLELPRQALHLVNASWNTKWRKSDQSSCLQFSSAFTTAKFRSREKWTPSIVLNKTTRPLRENNVDQANQMHCFCQSLIVYEEHTLPLASAKNHLQSPLRSRAMHQVKALVHQLDQETRGFFVEPDRTNQTRLVLVNRRKRSIGNPEAIVQLAKELGYFVTVADFDLMTPREQYHTARGADVFVSIHGMALTYATFMESSGAWSHCRTMIELMHWVNPSFFFYYEDLAGIANVSRVLLLPNDVQFGPSVVNKKREKILLKKNVFWWGMKGFDDQTAFYDLGKVREALQVALKNMERCTGLRRV